MKQISRPFGMMLAGMVAVLLLAGCSETKLPQAAGKGKVRGINAIVTAPELGFLIEERNQGNVNYRNVVGFNEWDDLSYDFNFDLLLPGAAAPERIATQFIDVVADTEYTLVLTGTIASPSILMWEDPEREWQGTETVFEADFVHLSPLLGEVDVYFAPEGTAPALGNEIATLNNGDRVPYQEFSAGDYELIVTAPGDPSTIIFQSSALARPAATRVTVALFDADASILSSVGVSLITAGGASQPLSDVDTPPQIRLYHGAFGTVNVDGFFNDDLNNVIFPDIGFSELSSYAEITELVTPVTLTAAGNTGALIHETEVEYVGNSRRTLALFGEPGALFTRRLPHDARPLETFPVVRITDLASNIDALDIYDVEAGTVVDDTIAPRFGGIVPGVSTTFFAGIAGTREFIVTVNGEKDPIAAPLALDLANGDVVDIVILDTVDPATVELSIFDSIP